jgi:adenylate kinase
MGNKVIWVGGIHGVGKTSSLKFASAKNSSLEYLYLGRMFFETAGEMGMRWEELADRSKLLEVEYEVRGMLEEKISKSDLLIDSHFAIHFGDLTYPGFHSHNLRGLFCHKDVKKYLIHLIADPVIILGRRNKSKKEFDAYPTKKYLEVIAKELDDEEDYLTYFVRALRPDVLVKTIDTSNSSIMKVAEKIGAIYNEI